MASEVITFYPGVTPVGLLLKSDWISYGVFEVVEQLSLKTFFNKLTSSASQGCFWPLAASMRSEVKKKNMSMLNLNEFWTKSVKKSFQ